MSRISGSRNAINASSSPGAATTVQTCATKDSKQDDASLQQGTVQKAESDVLEPQADKDVCPRKIGLETWQARRAEWTSSTLPAQQLAMRLKIRRHAGRLWRTNGPRQESIDQKQMIYERCIKDGKTFRQPINLGDFVGVMVAGWQKDGTWPQGAVVSEDSFFE